MPVWLLLKPVMDLLPVGTLIKVGVLVAVLQVAGVDVIGLAQDLILQEVTAGFV